MRKFLFLSVSHIAVLLIGFGLGIYALPILIAPTAPDEAKLQQVAAGAQYKAEFTRDLKGSDFLHWGEGTVSLSSNQIVHQGKLAPGPDYKLYLVKDFVENEEEFLPLKQQAKFVGEIKTFAGFSLDVPADVNISDYTTAVVWCETFSEFITAAKYR